MSKIHLGQVANLDGFKHFQNIKKTTKYSQNFQTNVMRILQASRRYPNENNEVTTSVYAWNEEKVTSFFFHDRESMQQEISYIIRCDDQYPTFMDILRTTMNKPFTLNHNKII